MTDRETIRRARNAICVAYCQRDGHYPPAQHVGLCERLTSRLRPPPSALWASPGVDWEHKLRVDDGTTL